MVSFPDTKVVAPHMLGRAREMGEAVMAAVQDKTRCRWSPLQQSRVGTPATAVRPVEVRLLLSIDAHRVVIEGAACRSASWPGRILVGALVDDDAMAGDRPLEREGVAMPMGDQSGRRNRATIDDDMVVALPVSEEAGIRQSESAFPR
jgi:hypothetical protein